MLCKSNIKIIDWPSKSLDLNIVENVWKIISDLVYDGNQPKNVIELREKINEAVDIINNEKRCVITNMFGTFRSRLTQVLIKNGNIIN